MKKLMDSKVVDTRYKVKLRTLIILGTLIHVLITGFAVFFVGKATNYQTVPLMITITLAALLTIIDAYLLLGALIKPITLATKRLVMYAEGDLSSNALPYTQLTEASVMVCALNSAIANSTQYEHEIQRVLKEVVNRNLTVEVKGDFLGDYLGTKLSLIEIIKVLNSILLQIGHSAGQVESSSGHLSKESQAMSEGATEQASSIEELSSLISVVTEQISKNAENAKTAREKAAFAEKETLSSNSQMNDMMTAMENISFKSSEISKINKIMDDIAFQTNLLALNAAVEAARAGAAGKGFAVVADEVRNLAGKSADAARNTTQLIEETIAAVENGSHITRETAISLDKSSRATKDVVTLIDQIAQASEEQANAIVQIDQGIEQISTVVQANAATSEESAAASEELSDQAVILYDLIKSFKLNNSTFPSQLVSTVLRR